MPLPHDPYIREVARALRTRIREQHTRVVEGAEHETPRFEADMLVGPPGGEARLRWDQDTGWEFDDVSGTEEGPRVLTHPSTPPPHLVARAVALLLDGDRGQLPLRWDRTEEEGWGGEFALRVALAGYQVRDANR